jgi:GNAT superfamily N-acetyltransferase
MADEIVITRLYDLTSLDLAELVTGSEEEGFAFVRRLIDEWLVGVNRFACPGEALFGATFGGGLVGVCGLNVDPYTTAKRVGRLRHLYVSARHRRCGVGSRLLAEILLLARGSFDRLRLRTNSESAAKFYEARGFRPSAEETACTHIIDLAG